MNETLDEKYVTTDLYSWGGSLTSKQDKAFYPTEELRFRIQITLKGKNSKS